MIFDGLKKLQSKGVKLQVAVNAPQTSAADTEELAAQGRSCSTVAGRGGGGGWKITDQFSRSQKIQY